MAKSAANRRSNQPGQPLRQPHPAIQPTSAKLPGKTAPTDSNSRTWPQTVLFGLFLASFFTPLVCSNTSFFGFVSERGVFFQAVVGLVAVVAGCKPGFWRVGWSWL